MPILIAICALVAASGAYVLVRGQDRRKRRREALAQPFPAAWDEILRRNLPPYARLRPELREELQRDTRLFLLEKSFEGCGGQTIDDEVRVTIAAQACMLLLNRQEKCYPRLKSIVVYPSTYVAGAGTSVRLGESWSHGTVVLAWDSVRGGARNFQDGRNVTMHEFAHQLDQEDGYGNGAPILEERSAYSAWARVFSREFEHHQRRVRKGKRTVMDRYGATNPAEFFAVASETFFEKPRQLQKKHPELYAELERYYNVSPLDWV